MSASVECPKCAAPFAIDVFAAVGSNQRFIWTVTPIEGAMMQAQAIGGQLVALDKMMKIIAREDGGRVRTYIESVSMSEDGAIAFSLAVLPVRKISATPAPKGEQHG